MSEMNILITDKGNQNLIAEYIYERLYNRFLKIFDYRSNDTAIYRKKNIEVSKNIFSEEYKNGFLMMASCSLLIETFSSFLEGQNQTPKGMDVEMFVKVFEKAKQYGNDLEKFINEPIYKNIRCAILHQGETNGNFKISRTGDLLKDKTINANRFFIELKKLLNSYKEELISAEWDSKVWDACRIKIRHIINNAK